MKTSLHILENILKFINAEVLQPAGRTDMIRRSQPLPAMNRFWSLRTIYNIKRLMFLKLYLH